MKSRKQVRRPRNKSKKFREMNGGGKGQKLNTACMLGDLNEAQRNWTGSNEDFRDEWRRTPLIAMVDGFNMEKKQDYLDVFYWLLNDLRCDVNKRDSWRNTALHYVLERSSFKIGEEIMRKDEKIVRNEMAMALINHPDIWPDEPNSDGNTPLHLACRYNFIEIVKLLIQKFGTKYVEAIPDSIYYVNINRRDKMRNTPLYIALEKGFTDIANILLNDENIDLDIRGPGGITPLMAAIKFENDKIIDRLLAYDNIEIQKIDQEQRTALHYAYSSNNFDVAIILLDRGAHIRRAVTENKNKTDIDKLTDNGIVSNEELRKFLEPLKKQNDERKNANSRILNSIKTREGLLVPRVLDTISEFARKDLSRPLTSEERKRSQDGRDRRNTLRSLKEVNKKKIDGKVLPNEILSKIRGFAGFDDEAIRIEQDDKLQKEIAFKNFGGKRKTKKRKTRKH